MTETRGIYHFGEEQQEASLSLLKDKLSITLRDGRSIFWYYREVTKEHVYDFRYTKYPPQLLRVSSSQFADELQSRIEKAKKSRNVGKLAPLAKVLLVFLVLMLLAYFLLVPWIASALANRFPMSYEKTIGDQAYNCLLYTS